MKSRNVYLFLATLSLSGCAALNPPNAERLAALPTVIYPDKPTGDDYVYKLPAGKPVAIRILADGDLLAANVEQSLSANLQRDLYLYKDWASEDGKHWQRADSLVGINLTVTLPSYRTPGPGEIHLIAKRKATQ